MALLSATMMPVEAGFRVEKELIVAQIQTRLIVAEAVDVVGHISDLQIAIGHKGAKGHLRLRIAGHVHFIAHRLVVAVLVRALDSPRGPAKNCRSCPMLGNGIDAHPGQGPKVVAQVPVPKAPQDVFAGPPPASPRTAWVPIMKVVQPALSNQIGAKKGVSVDDWIFQPVVRKGIPGAVLFKIAFPRNDVGVDIQIPVFGQVNFRDKLRMRLPVLVNFIGVAVVIVGAVPARRKFSASAESKEFRAM